MNRPRVTSRPSTAMELAFNKAVQEFATKKKPQPQPNTKLSTPKTQRE